MRKLFYFLLIVILLGGSLFIYLKFFYNPIAKKITDPELQRTPELAVTNFYKWYLEFKGHPLTSGAYGTSQFLTDNYKNKLRDASSNFKNLLYDPVLCAQDKPYDTEIEKIEMTSDDTGAVIIFSEDYYGTIVRNKISLIKDYNLWFIDDIECVDEGIKVSKDLSRQIIVYFLNSARSGEGTAVYGVARMLDDGEDQYQGALKRLFEGPTKIEKSQGFESSLKPGYLKGFFIIGDTAYVNLDNSVKDDLVDSDQQLQKLRNQVDETLKHRREIKSVIYAFDGSPQDFYDFIGIGCPQGDTASNYCNDQPFKGGE